MSRLFATLTLVAASTLTAGAAPDAGKPASAQPPAASAKCEATGSIVFQSDMEPSTAGPGHLASSAKPTKLTVRLFEHGGWTAERVTGTDKAQSHGCLGAAAVSKLETELTSVSWKQVADPDACGVTIVTGLQWTYRVNGKVVFVARECGIDALEPASQAALAHAIELTGKWSAPLLAPPPAPGP
jgi:hypothetical protein